MKKSILAFMILSVGVAFTVFGGGVISVNLTDNGGKTVSGAETYGLAPAVGNSWYNVVESGTEANPQSFTISVENETRDGAVKKLGEAVAVTFTTDASGSPFQRYFQAGIHGYDDAFMYNYFNDNGNITVDVANLPYKTYKVILYIGADWAGGTGGWDLEGPDFNPIQVNGSYYRYSVEAQAAVVCGTGAENCWGKYGSGTAEEGRNVLITPVQYGSPLQIRVPKCWLPRRSALCAFQIVEAEGELKPVPGAISVNFVDNKHEWNGEDPEGEPHKWRDTRVAQVGVINDLSGGWLRAESWNNAEYKSADSIGGSMKLKVWNGDDNPITEADQSEVTLTWSAQDTYFIYEPVPDDKFLYGYLSDGSEPSIFVSGIPYDEYDLIVYLSADWGGVTYGSWVGPDFNPVKVNGIYYTWSTETSSTITGDSNSFWGEYAHPKAQLGVNALRISGLTSADLSLSAGTSWNPRRGGIAAFQIIKPISADYIATDDITTKEINELATDGKEFSVEIPAGKKLILGKKPLVCSKLKVICKGDLVLDTDHEPNEADEATLAKINLEGVRGLVYHGWKPTARIISFNFYSDKGEMANGHSFAGAFAGEEVTSDSWNDIPSDTSARQGFSPKVWDGTTYSSHEIEGLTVDYDMVHVYGWGTAPEPFRRGWLTQGDRDWTISLAGIPFAKYDVICYFNWDGKAPFLANKINGVYYIGDENGVAQVSAYGGTWGMSGHSESAQMGVNAYRLNDQTSPTLSLSGRWMANLCALQIVEHAKRRVYPNPFIITIK